MAITIYENGAQREVYLFRNDGYMYTIGPANGTGKLFQPGTRGKVFDDVAMSARKPTFRMAYNTSGDYYYTRNVGNGYYAKWYDDVIHNQSTAPYTDNLGFDSIIRNDYDPLNAVWLFPCNITEFSYIIDDTRWGNKPTPGTFSLYNTNPYRFLDTNDTMIYKWEAHVSVTWDNFTNNSAVTDVYVAYLASNSSTYNIRQLTKIKQLDFRENVDRYGYAYFAGEYSQNVRMTAIVYPVLRLNTYATEFTRANFTVQTKFCFKDD